MKVSIRILTSLACCLVLFFAPLQAQTTARTALDDFLSSADLKHAGVSITILDALSGEELLAHNPELSLSPASVQKLITTSAALEILGSDYLFKTVLAYTGEIQENGLLDGSVVILGGGDPALQSEYFREWYPAHLTDYWAGMIQEAGITGIRGSVLADAAIYDSQAIPNGWSWDDVGNYYGAGVFGLTYRDNLQRITFDLDKKAGRPANLLRVVPEIPYINYNNEVVSSDDQGDNSYVYGGAYSLERWIRGSLPADRKEFTIKASIPDPPYLLSELLHRELETRGITIQGFPTSLRTPEERLVPQRTGLDTIFSPPLYEIVRLTNFESINLFAEHLVKEIGLHTRGDSRFETGLEVIADHWSAFSSEGVYLTDGSGLSRSNALTSRFLAEVLQYMLTASPEKETFRASLPLAGETGTMGYYFKESPLRERLQAKSGSMGRIRSFAGTFTTQTNRELVFVIITNNFTCKSMEMVRQMEVFLEDLDKIL